MKMFLPVAAIVALLGAAAAWAGQTAMWAHGRLLLVASGGAGADAATESERMLQRIQRLRKTQRQSRSAPYGTGFEVRKEMSTERDNSMPDRVEWPERIERMERPERVDRPGVGGGQHGGR